MSTFNVAIKIDATVLQGGATSTLVVPAGRTFKGQFSAYQSGGGAAYAEVRQNNGAGLRLLTVPMPDPQYGLTSTNNSTVVPVELGAGTYFLSIINGLNSAVAWTGTTYVNTL
jgi:hypothetical protein